MDGDYNSKKVAKNREHQKKMKAKPSGMDAEQEIEGTKQDK